MSDITSTATYVGEVQAEIERVEALSTDQLLEYLADRLGSYTVARRGGRYQVEQTVPYGDTVQIVFSTQETSLREAALCAVRGVIAWKGPTS